MRLALTQHPDFARAAVSGIVVEVARTGVGLALVYEVSGAIRDIVLPAGAARRTDELWRTTCFEAFVRGAGEGYLEFNFAPSGAWAAYAFSGYRDGMRPAEGIAAPAIEVTVGEARLEVRVGLSLPSGDGLWRLGLAAVIEEVSGATSYWALAHPPGRADFHHAAGFAAELGPMESA